MLLPQFYALFRIKGCTPYKFQIVTSLSKQRLFFNSKFKIKASPSPSEGGDVFPKGLA